MSLTVICQSRVFWIYSSFSLIISYRRDEFCGTNLVAAVPTPMSWIGKTACQIFFKRPNPSSLEGSLLQDLWLTRRTHMLYSDTLGRDTKQMQKNADSICQTNRFRRIRRIRLARTKLHLLPRQCQSQRQVLVVHVACG